MASRNKYLLRRFGITEEQYEELFQKQRGRCAICERPAETFKTKLAVDHNHKTREIRGLLCFYCNRYRVGRNTCAETLQRVVDYLKQSTGWFVPIKRKRKKKRSRKNRG